MLTSFLSTLWQITLELAPYLLAGFMAAGLIHSFLPATFVIKHLGASGIKGIVKAALIAVPMPLCSCSVIPVATALRKNGASNAATTAFLIATPQTGIDNILVVYAFLGLPFAIMSPIFTFFSGVIGGLMVSIFGENKIEEAKTNDSLIVEENEERTTIGFLPRIKSAVKYGFNTVPSDLAGSLILGIVISAILQVMVPDNFFENVTKNLFLQKLIMLAASIPVYVCSSGSVPIAATLIAKGISPGAALVFLMAGPASNAATITTMSKALGWRNMVIYLIAIAFSAIFFGTVLDEFFNSFSFLVRDLTKVTHLHSEGTSVLFYLMAILLIGLLGYHFFLPYVSKFLLLWHKFTKSSSKRYKIEIQGMQCVECSKKIRKALMKINGIHIVAIDYQKGYAIISSEFFSEELVKQTIERAGYSVKDISLT